MSLFETQAQIFPQLNTCRWCSISATSMGELLAHKSGFCAGFRFFAKLLFNIWGQEKCKTASSQLYNSPKKHSVSQHGTEKQLHSLSLFLSSLNGRQPKNPWDNKTQRTWAPSRYAQWTETGLGDEESIELWSKNKGLFHQSISQATATN